MVHPVLGTLDKMRGVDIPARMLVEGLLETFVREVYGTRRKDLIRLILTEGPRFPAHRGILLSRGDRAGARHCAADPARAPPSAANLPNDSLARFPQLIVAPMLVGIMWHSMFEKFEPLDVDAMIRAHIDILFAGRAS